MQHLCGTIDTAVLLWGVRTGPAQGGFDTNMLNGPVSLKHPLNECLDSDGAVRPAYQGLMDRLGRLGVPEMQRRWRRANDRAARDAFTFMLEPGEFRTVPTDWIPRIIPGDEWDEIARGVAERLKVINRFLLDLYCAEQEIVPPDVMFTSEYYNPELQDFHPARDVFVHIYGVDLVHMGDGEYVILEDNLRIPSGIAYQLKATEIGLREMPELADGYDIVTLRHQARLPGDVPLPVRHRLADVRAADRQQVRLGLL